MPHRRLLKTSNESGSLIMLLIAATVGLTVFVGLHLLFAMVWGGIHEAWWLNSGKTVGYTLVTLFFTALAVLYRSAPTMRGVAAMWVGVLLGIVSVTFATHRPDDMWPITLVMSAALTALAVLFGMVAAVGLKAMINFPGR